MKSKKEIIMTKEEIAYDIALRASGYELGPNDVKIGFRLAMLINEKKGDINQLEFI